MKFSLVTATYGRTAELERLLDSLEKQTHGDFELILVDQNPDDRLEPLISFRTNLDIVHLRRHSPGVSAARNLGLNHISGDVACFPDDDCWYAPDFLERVADLMDKHPEIDGFAGRVLDENMRDFSRFETSAGAVRWFNVWRRASAPSIFLRKETARVLGGFDETLGPNSGTAWGGAEDIDYALRAVRHGFHLYYDPSLVVFHPAPSAAGADMARRAYDYGAGIGQVWQKCDFPLWFVAYQLARPLGGAVLALATGQPDLARSRQSAFRGRLRGWLSEDPAPRK